MHTPPQKDILEAFHLSGKPTLLSGGQRTTWLVKDAILKPIEDEIVTNYVADIMRSIAEDGFRVARPLQAMNGSWIYKGWCAYKRIEGEHAKDRWEEKIAICKAFHKALSQYPHPDFFDKGTDRYTIADKIAWQELPLSAHQKVMSILQKLASLIRPINAQNQLIHGDFTGNILFQKGVLPGVIDFSPYWRPANYAIAIMVADAIVWEGADESIFALVSDIPDIYQLIVRAEIGRIIQVDRLFEKEGIDKRGEAEDHIKLIDILAHQIR